MQTFDAIIVGGGPSGSTCAAELAKCGIPTLLLDRATFPRVKLCGGWISEPIWEVLGLSPEEYTGGLWKWNKLYIHLHGKKYIKNASGYFVRRVEFDDYLLKRSKVEVIEGYMASQFEKDEEGYWVINKEYRAKYLIGAGGSHCPVARALFPKPDNLQFGTQERELEGNPEEIAACRAGEDGEPELLLHDDMKGYSWNVPKGSWLNIGSGTKIARDVLPAWSKARAFFENEGERGTIPQSSRPLLDKMKGHGYFAFHSNRLTACQKDNAFLIGDALGLAQPMTGEGILPSVLSGKLCGEAIAKGIPETYAKSLRTHPIISDYRVLHAIQTISEKPLKNAGTKPRRPSVIRDKIIVSIFSRLFAAKPIPGSWIISKMRK